MAGFLNLCVCMDGKIIKVPNVKWDNNKGIPQLSEQEVLHVHIAYEIEERNPSMIIGIWFDRLLLDELGKYTLNKNHPSLQNFINYALTSAEELCEREEPLTIPAAPVVPTQFEKEALNTYLKNKYPVLLKNSPQTIELTINRLKEQHRGYIDLVKKANSLRRIRQK
jgi:hypothetical protein